MLPSLPDAPLDIIGDIHGELQALEALLHHLGYKPGGSHPQGRRLVFVGDLCDRGPDSPGVIALVRRLVEAERAQAILGNHELNLLSGKHKHGNNWFWDETPSHDAVFEPYARVHQEQKQDLLAFLEKLPLTLQRDDLRIVHAAWNDIAVQRVLERNGTAPQQLFREWDYIVEQDLLQSGLHLASTAEKDKWRHALNDPAVDVPLLEATGAFNAKRQMGNPLRILTSGVERLARQSFYSSGEWRFAERVRWWDEYQGKVPVVIGHYWRQYHGVDRRQFGKGDPDLFENVEPTHWHGSDGKVFCVDFSVGGRYRERLNGQAGQHTRLAALRWPERTLVMDNGETMETRGYAR
jgi:hypothetical protein